MLADRQIAPPNPEVTAWPLRQLLSFDHSTGNLEFIVDLHDKQLVEMARLINHHDVLVLEGRDGLYLDVVVPEPSVRSLRIGLVQLDAIGDCAKQLADIAVYAEM